MSDRIFLDAPNVGSLEKKFLSRAIDVGYVSTTGPFVQDFENRLSEYLHAPNTVALQSGTAALHMALYELGIGKGDEVIVPALTFIASVNPIVYVGAKPVFVDVEPDSWNISPEAFRRHITKRTKAVIPVHLYGNPCRMDEILKVARRYRIPVIEDATESLGAKYRDKFTGTLGEFGCFSFNGNKIITTGGGGLLAGRSSQKIKHIKFLIHQAKNNFKGGYFHPEIGFNYRMTNIEASLGLAQMIRLNEFINKKREINRIYRTGLEDIGFVRFQDAGNGSKPSYWLTCVKFDKKIDINRLQKKLTAKNIPTRRIFMPVVEFPPFKQKRSDFKNAYSIYDSGLCLPSSTLNSGESIHFAAKSLKEELLFN